ncbi:MAG: hypothetical protein NZM31_03585, partial [Gemmatales bacterium]|nr:hypothetical protein [Gemmatales bacterium]MDW8386081.1 hypothetical protein [Gemmatales bacterium]
ELKEGKPTGRKILFKKDSKGRDVAHDPNDATFPEQGRPSEANHGNVTPSLSELDEEGEFLAGGVTIDRAEQTIVLSFPALRRLKFPVKSLPLGKTQEDVNVAARTVLAALGMCAAMLATESGLDLRSRCLLWPTEPLKWELLGKPGQIEKDVVLTVEQAIQLLKEAIQDARSLGLPWRDKPLRLVPSEDLVELVVKSQQLAAQKVGEGGE